MNHWIKIILLIFSFIIIFLHHFHFITVAREIWFSGLTGPGVTCFISEGSKILPPPGTQLDWMGEWRNLSNDGSPVRRKWGKDAGEKGIKITKTHRKWLILFLQLLISSINIVSCTAFIITSDGGELDRLGQCWNPFLKLSGPICAPLHFFMVFWENGKEVNIICFSTMLKHRYFISVYKWGNWMPERWINFGRERNRIIH